jgi:hypothetical protein
MLSEYQVFGPPFNSLSLSSRICPVGNVENKRLYYEGAEVDPREAKNPIVIYGPDGPRVFEEPRWEICG